MLIYNYQKEFLGIDEADLKSLGFQQPNSGIKLDFQQEEGELLLQPII